MSVRPGMNLVLTVLAVATAAPAAVRAALPAVQENAASYSLNLFSDVKGVHVYTQYVDYGVAFGSGVAAGIEWVHDKVVIPAIDAPPGSPEAIDSITSASRPIVSEQDAYEDFVKIRNSVQASVDYRGASVGYYVSSENDYYAQMVAGGYNRSFLDDNFNLAGGASYSWDRIKPFLADGGQGDESRTTTHLNLVATQILTATSRVRLGVELNDVSGQQHDPYRSVYVGGGVAPERHPDHRVRRNAFLNFSQYLGNESSLKADFRYYEDDWQVSSQTYGLKLNQRVSRELTFRYRYRYYTQLPAWFYRDDYRGGTSVDGYQSADYRLGAYGAHLFGGHVVWHPERLLGGIGFLRRTELNFTYERYFNSNNFTANIFETSVSITF